MACTGSITMKLAFVFGRLSAVSVLARRFGRPFQTFRSQRWMEARSAPHIACFFTAQESSRLMASNTRIINYLGLHSSFQTCSAFLFLSTPLSLSQQRLDYNLAAIDASKISIRNPLNLQTVFSISNCVSLDRSRSSLICDRA